MCVLVNRYEEQLREQQTHLQKEDLSDMVAEHAAKQKASSDSVITTCRPSCV